MEIDGFEWDDNKAAEVLAARGIAFSVACRVYDDADHLDLPDGTRHEYRWKVVGRVDSQLLTVVFAEGGDGRDRIVTAWYANTVETNAYSQQFA